MPRQIRSSSSNKTDAPDFSINQEQQLYVIRQSHGYSCLGFTVCENRIRAMSEWLEAQGVAFQVPHHAPGTAERYADYTHILSECQRLCLERHIRCDIELTPQLIGLEGKRVEVTDSQGETRRFIVGKSMGWMPIHLEIPRRDSSGGTAVIGAPFKSVRVV